MRVIRMLQGLRETGVLEFSATVADSLALLCLQARIARATRHSQSRSTFLVVVQGVARVKVGPIRSAGQDFYVADVARTPPPPPHMHTRTCTRTRTPHCTTHTLVPKICHSVTRQTLITMS